MIAPKLIYNDHISDNLLSNLESRDVVLWIRNLPKQPPSNETLIAFLGLPWRLIVSEVNNPELLKALENSDTLGPMTRKRGFVHIIDGDPSRIELPQRCLPVYLLNGRQNAPAPSAFENRLRRITMMDGLRRSGTREVLVISGDDVLVPPDLEDLWSSGFRSYLTFVQDAADTENILKDWLSSTDGVATATLLRLTSCQVIEGILARYTEVYPEHKRIIRMRDRNGNFHRIDITQVDDSERPILDWYSLIEERDLSPIVPEDLTEDDFIAFFKSSTSSWRPYAAGLPWIRDTQCKKTLSNRFKRLDSIGVDENCVAYIASEPGAGGSTLARTLAWEFAQQGYPVLIAKSLPFDPDALPVANFLNRMNREFESQTASGKKLNATPDDSIEEPTYSRYEPPWLIVFDSLHWQFRDNELVTFRNEMVKSGRPVCVLVVTDSALSRSFYNPSIFMKVSELNHALDLDEAHQLGHHLNQFLRIYGKQRQAWQWEKFYQDHTVRYLEGTSAFWVTLSFWIQGQFDLSESIQQWIYRSFKEKVTNQILQEAILEIAALSSERLPIPEGLLPASRGEWPLSVQLDDLRSTLANLGLMRVSANGEKYWALVHDILGRFLINALFYDFDMRKKLGFAEAKDAEHLRFLLLRKISAKPELGERAYRSVGEDFARSIFKIDPDHGRGSFISIWSEVLNALESMPRSLRDTSRVFRHHTAVSRRRIAKLDENFYGVGSDIKISLLNKAIEDINFALNSIEYVGGSESNLNLYNSLANAYFDLADIESMRGALSEKIMELRRLANDATRRAYEENPTNSFVIETYVKSLLARSLDSSKSVIENCIEALGVLFSAITSDESTYRKAQLGKLADEALRILLEESPKRSHSEPSSVIDILIEAWTTLAEGIDYKFGMVLSDIPEENRTRALQVLQHPGGQGNMQVIHLKYDLLCINDPDAFKEQLELVEQLQATNYRITPQLRLEYAILLFQNDRAIEGDGIFRSLRKIWRENEYFVYIPERIRWLRDISRKELKKVHGITASDYGHRAMARVQEFNKIQVPFRPEEFSFRDMRPGVKITCHVSFGHNGPFLRPTTAVPAVQAQQR